MFRTVFTKSLRDYRWAIRGWGIGLGILVYAQYATFAQTFDHASAAQIRQLVEQFRFFGEAVKVGTPGGFVTFKLLGILPLVLGVWTILAGARMTRGEEERGALDLILATPHSRTSVLALLLAQFTSRAAAAEWAGASMVLAYVLDGTGRAMSSAAAIRPISPFYYYNRNLPLVPGYPIHGDALLGLIAAGLVLTGLAALFFTRRDLGRTVLADVAIRQHPEEPDDRAIAHAATIWTGGVGLQALRRQGPAMLWWIVSLAIFAGYLVVMARTSERQFQKLFGSSSFIQHLYSGANVGTNSGFVSVLVFGYLPLLLAIFAGLMSYRWAADLDGGRLELVLATPQPRPRVILARYAAVLTAATLTAFTAWLVITLLAGAIGFTLDPGRVAQASIGMLPLALITASLVFAVSGILRPGATLAVMVVFLAASYLTDLLKTLLSLPTWIVNLSIFRQYGTPVLTGLNWEAFTIMLAIAATLLVKASQFRPVRTG